jgi:hypothetical protein
MDRPARLVRLRKIGHLGRRDDTSGNQSDNHDHAPFTIATAANGYMVPDSHTGPALCNVCANASWLREAYIPVAKSIDNAQFIC